MSSATIDPITWKHGTYTLSYVHRTMAIVGDHWTCCYVDTGSRIDALGDHLMPFPDAPEAVTYHDGTVIGFDTMTAFSPDARLSDADARERTEALADYLQTISSV